MRLAWPARSSAKFLILILLLVVTAGLAAPALATAHDATPTRPAANQDRQRADVLAYGSGYRSGGSARVRELQAELSRLGYAPGPLDGLYGPLTTAAVVRFQAVNGLARDGVAGPLTLRRLHGQRRISAATVRSAQRALRRLGRDPGRVDGILGPRTVAALRGFQRAEGLPADGLPRGSTTARLTPASAAKPAPPVVAAPPAQPGAPVFAESKGWMHGWPMWALIGALALALEALVAWLLHRRSRRRAKLSPEPLVRPAPPAPAAGDRPSGEGFRVLIITGREGPRIGDAVREALATPAPRLLVMVADKEAGDFARSSAGSDPRLVVVHRPPGEPERRAPQEAVDHAFDVLNGMVADHDPRLEGARADDLMVAVIDAGG